MSLQQQLRFNSTSFTLNQSQPTYYSQLQSKQICKIGNYSNIKVIKKYEIFNRNKVLQNKNLPKVIFYIIKKLFEIILCIRKRLCQIQALDNVHVNLSLLALSGGRKRKYFHFSISRVSSVASFRESF